MLKLAPAIDEPRKYKVPEDDTLEQLTVMTNKTCLVAIDKSLKAIARIDRGTSSYTAACERLCAIGDRMIRASREVRLCLPKDQICF